MPMVDVHMAMAQKPGYPPVNIPIANPSPLADALPKGSSYFQSRIVLDWAGLFSDPLLKVTNF